MSRWLNNLPAITKHLQAAQHCGRPKMWTGDLWRLKLNTGWRQCSICCKEEDNEQTATHILSTRWEVFNGKFRAWEPFHSTLISSCPGTTYQSTETIVIKSTEKIAKDGAMQTHCSFTCTENLEVHLPTLTSSHACTLPSDDMFTHYRVSLDFEYTNCQCFAIMKETLRSKQHHPQR